MLRKNFKNGTIWKPMKGQNSKSYGPLAIILPLHLPYLRDQVWYKFHQSRTTNIKVIVQNAFWFFENLPRDISPRVMEPWSLFRYTRYIQSLSMFIGIFTFLAFIVPEKSVTKILKELQTLETYEGTELQEFWAFGHHSTTTPSLPQKSSVV